MEQNTIEQKIQEFVAKIEAKNPNEPEFLQAVKEVADAIDFTVTDEKKEEK